MNLNQALMWIARAVEHARLAISQHTHELIRRALARIEMLLAIQRAAAP